MQESNSNAAKADDTRLLKVLLMVGGVYCLFAGAVQFLFPGIDAILAGVEPGELDWIYRLLGSAYIGLGTGMLGVYRNPAGQGVFITMLIVMTALACIAFIITLFTAPYSPIPVVLCILIVALALLVYGRQKAKDIL
ncbi:MAG: hypothetical protein ACYSWO_13290 [Planctomycetota bacterium]|jgi:hypothetical protein